MKTWSPRRKSKVLTLYAKLEGLVEGYDTSKMNRIGFSYPSNFECNCFNTYMYLNL